MSGDLERLARIIDRIDDDEQRERLRARLEGLALDELADQEEPKLPGPAKVEPDPPSSASNPEMADLLTEFRPEVQVKITPTRIDWWVGPRGYR